MGRILLRFQFPFLNAHRDELAMERLPKACGPTATIPVMQGHFQVK